MPSSSLHLEAAVVGLARVAVAEDDHRGDDVGRAEVRDVEALDADRRDVEAERLAQALQALAARSSRALGATLLAFERQRGVALGQLEELALLAALGRAQLDL